MGIVAYDKRNGRIQYGWATPKGNYALPDWEFVFQGNRDIIDNLGIVQTDLELTTLQAQRYYRIWQGQLLPKPTPELSASPAYEGQETILTVMLHGLQEGEEISDIKAMVAGVGLVPAQLELKAGENRLVFEILGELVIKIDDERLLPASIHVEVMPLESD